MTIMQIPQYWNKNILILGLIAVLTACGGGGGGNDNDPIDPPPPVSDTTPDSFTFTAVSNADVNAFVESNSITIDGINAATAISITGGEYKIASGEYTSSNSTVTDGQSVTVRLTTLEAGNQTHEATLLIGGVSATFTVTTRPDDTTPDAFSFTAVTDAAVGAEVTSEAITISGINAAASISVADGEYSVDGGEFTTDEGTVVEGQSITVRATSSNDLNTRHTVVLTIGGVAGQFEITTLADTTAPVAEIMFPPPVSMTEGTVVYVRVKVSDENSDIKSAQIKLDTAAEWQSLTLVTHEDGTLSWDAEVLLENGDNTIVVATEDSADNREENAAQVMVRSDATLGSFPSAENPIAKPVGMALDKVNDRLLVIEDTNRELFAIDINTGARSLFSDFSGVVHSAPEDILIYEKAAIALVRDDGGRIITVDIDDPSQIASYDLGDKIGPGLVFSFDELQESLIASNFNTGSLWNVALDFSDAEIFSDNTNDSQGMIIANPHRGMAYDRTNQGYYVTAPSEQAIYFIDRNGERSLFSDNSIGGGETYDVPGQGYLWRVIVDDQKQRLLVLEADTGKVFYVNLDDQERYVLSSPSTPDNLNPMDRITGLAVNSFEGYAFVSDQTINSIFALDLVTGHRVYFSKN